MDNGFRESVHDEATTSKFHYPYFISDILVVSYVLSCAECLPWAPAVARIPLKQMLHGDRTALPYRWGRRTEALVVHAGMPAACFFLPLCVQGTGLSDTAIQRSLLAASRSHM